jgi:hypothetical protein
MAEDCIPSSMFGILLLRQQEEFETQITIGQARVFQRPAVNERELERKQQVLKSWKADAAKRPYAMVDELRSKHDKFNRKSELLDDEEADGDELDTEVAWEYSIF